jgi:AcrR family transcriptional regulator
MPKVSEEHRLAKHDEILNAALRAFERKGFQATSMSEIIAESGMSAGAIYGYFPGKADIVRDVAMRVVTERMADLDAVSQFETMPEPSVIVGTILHGMIGARALPSIQAQVWGEAVTDPKMREVCVDIINRVRTAFERYLARWHVQAHGLSEKDASRIAQDQAPLFVSAIHGFVIQDSLLEHFDREGYITRTLPHLPS